MEKLKEEDAEVGRRQVNHFFPFISHNLESVGSDSFEDCGGDVFAG